MTDVILLVHGSPDPRAGAAAGAFARAIESRDPALRVHVAALDNGPSLTDVCRALDAVGVDAAVVVPAFVTSAHHVRVDVPASVAGARENSSVHLEVTAAIGVDEPLLCALDRLLPDGPVVAAVAGTSDERALAELDSLATRWAEQRGTRVVVGHASQSQPDVAKAISVLERATGEPVGVAALVLFPGHLPDRIDAAADGRVITPALSLLPETVDLVLERLRRVTSRAA